MTTLEHEPPSRRNREVSSLLDFVVARALKKDPAVRYQDAYEMAADLRDALAEMRGRKPAPRSTDAEATHTLRLEPGAQKLPLAPAASAIARDTRLPLSRIFDSEAALERLAQPGTRGGRRLVATPRRVSLLRKVLRDRWPRRLFAAVVVAACAGGLIAFG